MKLVGWAQSVVTFHGGASQHLDSCGVYLPSAPGAQGMTLFLLFPFSRLVHIWSVPVEYLTRIFPAGARSSLTGPRILVHRPCFGGDFYGPSRDYSLRRQTE
ncbi:respiratory nitrate reductase subunit gamma [Escherichia coli]|nr:respiratory nitrate reductase subunit gamma [Escherichia coli]